MRDDLGNLARFNGIIQCEVEIVGHIDPLAARDEGGDGNDAAVPCANTQTAVVHPLRVSTNPLSTWLLGIALRFSFPIT
jgi:hypothetical protein